ncbi:MAG: hypothetical protein Q8S26_16330 [Azonexus sp.]|nr:hypothetical protein [Azonexus sp.]
MAHEHPLSHRFLRMVVVSSCWLAFAVIGFWVYATYIHDVGATYWVMQVFLLPVALPFVVILDFQLLRQSALALRFGVVTALDSGFAILLWLWPLWALGLLLVVVCLRLLPMVQALGASNNPMEKS